MKRSAALPVLLVLLCPPLMQVLGLSPVLLSQSTGQAKPRFATEDEIKLLLTQTERALANYDAAVKMEALEFGKGSGFEKDEEEGRTFREVLSKLKTRPDLFNGPFRFLLIVNL